MHNVLEKLIFGFLSSDSDLALRNCLLTSEMSVKIGDYGLSQSRYKVRLTFDIVTAFFMGYILAYHLLNTQMFLIFIHFLFCRMIITLHKTRFGCPCAGLHLSS